MYPIAPKCACIFEPYDREVKRGRERKPKERERDRKRLGRVTPPDRRARSGFASE